MDASTETVTQGLESALGDALASRLGWWPTLPWEVALATLAVGISLALIVQLLARLVIPRITARTTTDVDDAIARAVRWPATVTVLWVSIGRAASAFTLSPWFEGVLWGFVQTVVVMSWTFAGIQIVDLFLKSMDRRRDEVKWINARTEPVFAMTVKAVLFGGATYFFFLAWDLDLTGWIASAGIAGVAVGFAAQDTLRHLFAGLFILADAPYKLGDVLQLDSGERGRVEKIGIRTTRIVTNDDVEIIVPNGLIADGIITNESGGPRTPLRISTTVEAAYGSDIDLVRALLIDVGAANKATLKTPGPQVVFSTFGASGLVFHLRIWVRDPRRRDVILDELNVAIYKGFAKAGIEIPYSKHDVYVHQAGSES